MTREKDIQKLAELMKDVKICMLATHDSEGQIHSRPMAMQQVEFDGDLWFFTGKSTEKTGELKRDHHVNLSFADTDKNTYVSVSGLADCVDDSAKAKELWNPLYKAWFPKGLDDPNLTLMKVHVHKAEYWDSPNGVVTQLLGFVKAVATGQRAEVGEHEKIELGH
jgi:general stress protein 26